MKYLLATLALAATAATAQVAELNYEALGKDGQNKQNVTLSAHYANMEVQALYSKAATESKGVAAYLHIPLHKVLTVKAGGGYQDSYFYAVGAKYKPNNFYASYDFRKQGSKDDHKYSLGYTYTLNKFTTLQPELTMTQDKYKGGSISLIHTF